MTEKLKEPVLDNDYPVYAGYVYICNGKPIVSDIQGTVLDLKRDLGVAEVKRCDLIGRGLL